MPQVRSLISFEKSAAQVTWFGGGALSFENF